MLQNRLKLKGKIQILSWVSYIDSMPERKQCTFLEQPMLHDQIWLSPGNEKNNYKANGKKNVSSLLLYRTASTLQSNVQNIIQSWPLLDVRSAFGQLHFHYVRMRVRVWASRWLQGTLSSANGRAAAHMNLKCTACTKPVQEQSILNPSMGRVVGHTLLLLGEVLLAIIRFCEKRQRASCKHVTIRGTTLQ